MSVKQQELWRTVVRVGEVLRDADIPYALTGGCAVFARGGPPSEHDVDIAVAETDISAAVRVLVAAGLRTAPVDEDWLAKLYDGEHMVDLLFRLHGEPVTHEQLRDVAPLRIGPDLLPVQSATDVMTSKLRVLGPDRCDFAPLLAAARALREQIDWPELTLRSARSPYIQAFLLLAHQLGLDAAGAGAPDEAVRATRPEDEQAEARLRRLLAEDPEVGEQGLQVTVHGRQVSVTGAVASPERRWRIMSALSHAVPDRAISVDLMLVPAGAPDAWERL